MPDEVPNSGASYPDFLLDFLYVDVARVRSYLAQLAGGVATTASEALEQTRGLNAEVAVPVVRGGRTSSTSDRWETTRTLGDLIVPAFEEESAAAGYLVDISEDMSDPTSWQSGGVHERLPIGTIFRHSGPTRLLDPLHVSELIEHFEGTAEAIDRLSGKSSGSQRPKGSGRVTPKGGTPAAQAGQLRAMKKVTEPIRNVVKNLLAGGISLRVFPCGPQYPDYGFGGLLLDRSDYIEPERSAVFARHGVTVTDWTVLAVVTRLPTEERRRDLDPIDPTSMVRGSGAINRQALEGAILQLLEVIEGLGLSEGPAWPSIGITPLAVYRTIPKAP